MADTLTDGEWLLKIPLFRFYGAVIGRGGQGAVAIQNTEEYFPVDEVTLASRLKEAGYATHVSTITALHAMNELPPAPQHGPCLTVL